MRFSLLRRSIALFGLPAAAWFPGQANADSDVALVTGYVLTGVMADGVWTHQGAAACPPNFALGTQIQIDGLGTFICEDRLAPWMSFRFDLWEPTLANCYAVTGYYGWRVARGFDASGSG